MEPSAAQDSIRHAADSLDDPGTLLDEIDSLIDGLGRIVTENRSREFDHLLAGLRNHVEHPHACRGDQMILDSEMETTEVTKVH